MTAKIKRAWTATRTPSQLPALRALVREAHDVQPRDPAFLDEWEHWTGRDAGSVDRAPARSSGPLPEPQDHWVLRDRVPVPRHQAEHSYRLVQCGQDRRGEGLDPVFGRRVDDDPVGHLQAKFCFDLFPGPRAWRRLPSAQGVLSPAQHRPPPIVAHVVLGPGDAPPVLQEALQSVQAQRLGRLVESSPVLVIERLPILGDDQLPQLGRGRVDEAAKPSRGGEQSHDGDGNGTGWAERCGVTGGSVDLAPGEQPGRSNAPSVWSGDHVEQGGAERPAGRSEPALVGVRTVGVWWSIVV